MFEHVMVGYDGQDGGRDAIALAAALRPTRLTIVMAYGPETFLDPTILTDYWDALRADAKRRLQAAALDLGVEADLVAVADTSPAHALHHLAEQRQADLLVVGSAHHGPVGRLMLGDVGRDVLHGAPCPVAVAPRRLRGSGWRPRRIAVGYDGSAEARHALEVALRVAPEQGAEVELVTAWEEPPMAIAAYAYLEDVERLAAENELRAQRVLDDGIAAAGPSATGRLLHGPPRRVLADLSPEVDLIVVGSRGYGAARRVMLGSTSDHLVHRAQCPVLVVGRPPSQPDKTAHDAGAAQTVAG